MVKDANKSQNRIHKAISALAGLYQCGELLADTQPDKLLNMAVEEIKNSRSEAIHSDDEYALTYWVHGNKIVLDNKNKYDRYQISVLIEESGATCVNWTTDCLIITTKYKNVENISHMFWLIRMGYYGEGYSEYLNERELSYRPQIFRRFAEDGVCSCCGSNK